MSKLLEPCPFCGSTALQDGYKAEDARYMLPEATKTEIFVTMNVRELFHFLTLRADAHA